MLEKLQALIKEWEKEAAYFNGPDDHPSDKAVGKTYAECAEQLKEVVASITAVQGDACHLANSPCRLSFDHPCNSSCPGYKTGTP